MLPTDIAYQRIPVSRLKTPLNLEPPENDADVEAFVLDEIVKLVEEAKNDVIILVDACAIRHGVKGEVKELYERTGFPVYAAPMGKTAVDETYSRYGGVCGMKCPKCFGVLTMCVPDLRRIYLPWRDQGEGRECEANPFSRRPEERLHHRQLHLQYPHQQDD